MKRPPQSKQRRIPDSELPEDLRPLPPQEPLPDDSDVRRLFIEYCDGDPSRVSDGAALASAGLVIAEQIAELTTAIHTLSFMLCKNQ